MQFPGQQYMEVLGQNRGMGRMAMQQLRLCAEKHFWASFFTATGYRSVVDILCVLPHQHWEESCALTSVLRGEPHNVAVGGGSVGL